MCLPFYPLHNGVISFLREQCYLLNFVAFSSVASLFSIGVDNRKGGDLIPVWAHFWFGSTSGLGPLLVRALKNHPKMLQNILLHSSMITPDIGLNSIFCCLKMKWVLNIVLNWFHFQTTRKSCWQPEMSGWIQATMHQNTISCSVSFSQDIYQTFIWEMKKYLVKTKLHINKNVPSKIILPPCASWDLYVLLIQFS